MLYGAPGSGKTTLARYLAQLWMCTRMAEGKACGECQACKAFERGNASDFHLVEPHGLSRLITIDQITEKKNRTDDDAFPIQTFLRTMPLMASNKVILIESCERMNGASVNALLKTLEEPHAYAKFILTTPSVGQVLSTVVSRCLAIACEMPHASPSPPPLSALSEGSVGTQKRLEAHAEVYEKLIQFADGLTSRPRAEALAASDELKKLGDAIEETKFGNARSSNAEALRLVGLRMAQSEHASPEHVQAIIEAHRRIQGNGNATQVFDGLMVQILRG